jgi:PIN domain nuclease of toxin-antitoxin system
MNILLDTPILLWHLTDNPRLSREYSAAIEDPKNQLFFSIVSLWEMAIKSSIGKLELLHPIDKLVPSEMAILNLKMSHIKNVQTLALHHRDPFDRMIISQAMIDHLFVMTDDANFKYYDIKIF